MRTWMRKSALIKPRTSFEKSDCAVVREELQNRARFLALQERCVCPGALEQGFEIVQGCTVPLRGGLKTYRAAAALLPEAPSAAACFLHENASRAAERACALENFI